MVGIHVDPNVSIRRIQGWVKDHNGAFAALHNGPKIGGYTKVRQVAQTYRVFGTPTFFFVDKTGLI